MDNELFMLPGRLDRTISACDFAFRSRGSVPPLVYPANPNCHNMNV
jgi:hypothetical protein